MSGQSARLGHLHSKAACEGVVGLEFSVERAGALCHPVQCCQVVLALRLSARLLLTLNDNICLWDLCHRERTLALLNATHKNIGRRRLESWGAHEAYA